MSRIQRIQAVYSGYVQGVGFRFTARRIASAIGVAGYVKNLPNGNVLLVGEGTREQLESLLNDIKDRMSDNIRDVSVEWAKARNDHSAFDVEF